MGSHCPQSDRKKDAGLPNSRKPECYRAVSDITVKALDSDKLGTTMFQGLDPRDPVRGVSNQPTQERS